MMLSPLQLFSIKYCIDAEAHNILQPRIGHEKSDVREESLLNSGHEIPIRV